MSDRTPESYKKALAELDTLLSELEGDDVDIDQLAEKVERAAGLLKYCRARLGTTETRVKEIVASLDESAEKRKAVPAVSEPALERDIPF